MSSVDVLLGLVIEELCLKRLLHIFALVFEIKNASIAGCIDHFSLHCVDFLCQKSDSLTLVRYLSLIVNSPLYLLPNNLSFVFSHMLKLVLALKNLCLQLDHEILASRLQALYLHTIGLFKLVDFNTFSGCDGGIQLIHWTTLGGDSRALSDAAENP